jgi:hypothetical protein
VHTSVFPKYIKAVLPIVTEHAAHPLYVMVAELALSIGTKRCQHDRDEQDPTFISLGLLEQAHPPLPPTASAWSTDPACGSLEQETKVRRSACKKKANCRWPGLPMSPSRALPAKCVRLPANRVPNGTMPRPQYKHQLDVIISCCQFGNENKLFVNAREVGAWNATNAGWLL